jgi:hypothetical protein
MGVLIRLSRSPIASHVEAHVMLYVSLLVSAVMLAGVHRAARKHSWPFLDVFFIAGGLAVAPMFLMVVLPPVFFQGLLIVGAMLICAVPRWHPRAFLATSYAVTVAAYGCVAWLGWQRLSELREEFAFESMEERLPVSPAASTPLRPETLARLGSQERVFEAEAATLPHGVGRRNASLRAIHEGTLSVFVEQSGFGVTRMREVVSRATLTWSERQDDPQPQPELPSAAETLVWGGRVSVADHDAPWMELHSRSVLDFAHPEGYGFIKDRRHVAGFRPHRFLQAPKAEKPWALRHLDLIGLVRHEKPVAYVSANLPRMDELRKAPTRPLDDFESAGLKALRAGEDLFVAEVGDVRRMLGAVRSAKQCVECHGGQRGDLLGAFSYTFRKAEAP